MSVVQDERQKPAQQFSMRFGAAMDNMSVSRNSKIFSNKLEKEKAFEGQRLPMSPMGMLLQIQIVYHRNVIPFHFKSLEGVTSHTYN